MEPGKRKADDSIGRDEKRTKVWPFQPYMNPQRAKPD